MDRYHKVKKRLPEKAKNIFEMQKTTISYRIKKFLDRIGLYKFIKKIYTTFIIFIGRNGLKLRINGVSAKIIISNPTEVSIWRFLYNEGELIQKFLDRINDKTIFYDIGAHIGLYSLVAAKYKITPKFIYCWEPNPSNYKRLKENINLNKVTIILPFPVALGSESGIFQMSVKEKEEKQGYLVPSFARVGQKTMPIKVVKGDEWVLNQKLYLPTIIKIDVEGYELNVLEGFEETIRKSKPIIFLEIHPVFLKNLGFNKEQILSFLQKIDYETVFSSIRGKQEHYILEALNKRAYLKNL